MRGLQDKPNIPTSCANMRNSNHIDAFTFLKTSRQSKFWFVPKNRIETWRASRMDGNPETRCGNRETMIDNKRSCVEGRGSGVLPARPPSPCHWRVTRGVSCSSKRLRLLLSQNTPLVNAQGNPRNYKGGIGNSEIIKYNYNRRLCRKGGGCTKHMLYLKPSSIICVWAENMKASDLTPWRGPSELRDSRAERDAANADHATVTDHRGFHAPDNGEVMRNNTWKYTEQ
jgi:hypothetical protein